MREYKFKKGDRVKVIETDEIWSAHRKYIDTYGIVQEDDDIPYVKMDLDGEEIAFNEDELELAEDKYKEYTKEEALKLAIDGQKVIDYNSKLNDYVYFNGSQFMYHKSNGNEEVAAGVLKYSKYRLYVPPLEPQFTEGQTLASTNGKRAVIKGVTIGDTIVYSLCFNPLYPKCVSEYTEEQLSGAKVVEE